MARSPVIEAVFPTGSELVLWHPDRDRWRLRVEHALMCGITTMLATGAEAVIVMILISYPHPAPATVALALCAVAGAIAVVISVVRVCVEYACFEYDHCHRPDQPCGLERHPGEFLYRPSDFATVSPGLADVVERILRDMKNLHDSPARGWLPPGLLESAHRLVWNALTVAHATGTARRAMGQARDHDALTDLAAKVGHDLGALDDHLGQIGDYLHQAAWLTQAWERKLDRVREREALRTELAGVAVGSLTDEVSAALALSEATFAALTAARDVLDAGPFAWEQAESPAAMTIEPIDTWRATVTVAGGGS